jgi:hypothetical protein
MIAQTKQMIIHEHIRMTPGLEAPSYFINEMGMIVKRRDLVM